MPASVDLVVWPLVVLFVLRALFRHQPHWWLLAGPVVGLSTYNKWLVIFLVLSIILGLLRRPEWRAARCAGRRGSPGRCVR
jgi:4-amino-4-deoxy-L-arabinose transferase-like glycosyltransferase